MTFEKRLQTKTLIYVLLASILLSFIQACQKRVAPAKRLYTGYFHNYLTDRDEASDVSQPLALALKRFFRERKGHALDIGVGTGRDTLALLQDGFKVTAIDSEPQAIAVVKRRVPPTLASSLELKLQNFQSLRISQPYDLVNVSSVTRYFPEAEFPAIWAKIKDSVRIGGFLAIDFFGVRASNANETPKKLHFTNLEVWELFKAHYEIKSFEVIEGAVARGKSRQRYGRHQINVLAQRIN